MRVIGGTLKSRKFYVPKIRTTRPVTDRAKETIFNVLGALCEGAVVLDLFAGSGSLGIEALSRGAGKVCFVDSERAACLCISKNLELLDLSAMGRILDQPIPGAIKSLEKWGEKYTLAFLDPPHNKGLIKKVLYRIDRSDIIMFSGIIVVGRSNLEGLPQDLKTLSLQREIKIGQTFVSLLTKAGNE
ncbi:MAG TPA: 16S rRNA (guanine(966)-N(2))-methyltransferase RsmD [Candidatus Omnitrophota bacterium]|nr:16S rRNA (guanine(966)-N(2))-methyltransferase RsmD [Candidatus Omnitrophota bacterium]